MDTILQNNIQKLVETSYKSLKNISNYDYTIPLQRVLSNTKVLHVLQKKYIEFDLDLKDVKENLKDFINDLVSLSASLKIKQDENINFTNKALNEKNTNYYLQEKSNENKVLKEKDTLVQKQNVENLILLTEKRYTEKFNEFETYQMADKIISKEFEETKEFLPDLEKIKNLQYNHIDNLSRLISSMTDMATEAVQLSAVLVRAERFLNKTFKEKQTFKPMYFMFDGVNSTNILKKDSRYYEKLKEKSNILNSLIKKDDNLSLICNFVALKQDEIHGVVNGKVEDFIALAQKTFAGIDLRLVYSDKEITNIEQTVFGNPYELFGPACSDCRKKLNENKNVINLKDGFNIDKKSSAVELNL